MSAQNIFVSVVVPFYNIEQFASKCIDSLLAQTYDNFELVLIDDGSTDGTPAVLDSYSDDLRVKVHHFQNGGLSVARNRGVAEASGDYISFVDGDDYVAPRYLELLVGGLEEEPDALVASIELVVPSSGEVAWGKLAPSYRRLLPDEAMCELAYDRIKTAAWGKLAPRSLYERIPFPEGRMYEEISTAGDFLLGVKRIVVLDQPVYAYVMHGGSIVNRRSASYGQIDDYDKAIALICAAIGRSGVEGVEYAQAYQAALQHMRMMPLVKCVVDEHARAEARWGCLIAELRAAVPSVVRDSRASVVSKARILLAAYLPSVYLALINMRDRRRAR